MGNLDWSRTDISSHFVVSLIFCSPELNIFSLNLRIFHMILSIISHSSIAERTWLFCFPEYMESHCCLATIVSFFLLASSLLSALPSLSRGPLLLPPPHPSPPSLPAFLVPGLLNNSACSDSVIWGSSARWQWQLCWWFCCSGNGAFHR